MYRKIRQQHIAGGQIDSVQLSTLIRANQLLSREQPAIPGSRQTHRETLPTSCLKCGASLRADEVEWVDVDTAECDYCGSLNRAEGR